LSPEVPPGEHGENGFIDIGGFLESRVGTGGRCLAYELCGRPEYPGAPGSGRARDRVSRYVNDGSDQDLRRLLRGAGLVAEPARTAFRRAGVQHGWNVIDCG
jgi:hypothetical protein